MHLTDEQLDLLKARDVRLRALDTSLLVEQELRESKTLSLILQAIEDDAGEAVEQFADANPLDTKLIGALQARVHRLFFIKRTINLIRSAGAAAAAALQAEDVIEE